MSVVNANPTKQFFVTMLTRDIELSDSIFDLIDNCIDGLVRLYHGREIAFAAHTIDIKLSNVQFLISDNCGGIPKNVAEHYAFRFGRPDARNEDFGESIGAYGIGMKRSIFKLGRAASVVSATTEGIFEVLIPDNWVKDPTWEFPLNDIVDDGRPRGTIITITDLHDSVSRAFVSEFGFLENLKINIARQYSKFLQRGLKILINAKPIKARSIGIIADSTRHVEPYVFKFAVESVEVSGIVGFVRPALTESELDQELDAPNTEDSAGISVVCNNRVVLYNDRTYTTGWGINTTPRYHGQFANIGGMITFTSNDAALLPLTTTKRGVDLDSLIYQRARELTSRGLKRFTDYTNKWKGQASPDKDAQSTDAFTLLESYLERADEPIPYEDGHQFAPDLALPVEDDRVKSIVFKERNSRIAALTDAIYGGPEAVSASKLGSDCFNFAFAAYVSKTQE